MRDEQFKEFAADLEAVFKLYGKEPTADQKGLFFRVLRAFPLVAVKRGLESHMADPHRGRFAPLPADVVAQIESLIEQQDGRPGAEEAWALCLRCQDEAETIVWTAEMAQAWEVARAVLPDEIGARMAFKEAYGRMTDEARRERQPAKWSVSLGHDPQRRSVAISAAVDAGRLPPSEMPLALPAPQRGLMLLQYVGELAARPDAPDECRARLLEIRDRLAKQAEVPSEDADAKARTQQLKDRIAAAVAARLVA